MKSYPSFRDFVRTYNNVNLINHIYRCLTIPSYRIIWMYRIFSGEVGKSLVFKVLYFYYLRYSRKYQIELHPSTKIGTGLLFPHNGPIVINASAIIGENCMIHPCVLIGGDRKNGSPVIGNNCFIGHGSKLIGKIEIGSNTFISPGAVITKNIPENCIVGAGLNNILKTTGGIEAVNRYLPNPQIHKTI